MCVDHQILILEWFLKDHVTLKTGVMMLKITGINYTLLYIHMIYCIFDHRNEVFQLFCSKRCFFMKLPKIQADALFFLWIFCIISVLWKWSKLLKAQVCVKQPLMSWIWKTSSNVPQSWVVCVCVCVCVGRMFLGSSGQKQFVWQEIIHVRTKQAWVRPKACY